MLMILINRLSYQVFCTRPFQFTLFFILRMMMRMRSVDATASRQGGLLALVWANESFCCAFSYGTYANAAILDTYKDLIE
jgi:hypothetical protein